MQCCRCHDCLSQPVSSCFDHTIAVVASFCDLAKCCISFIVERPVSEMPDRRDSVGVLRGWGLMIRMARTDEVLRDGSGEKSIAESAPMNTIAS